MKDEEIVEEVATTVEEFIFSEIGSKNIEDYEVNVTFEDGDLEIDVYINAPGYNDEIAMRAVEVGHERAEELFD